MQIKSIVAGAAIALAATVGSASAADQFATLGGVSAESLAPVEMAAVVGALTITVIAPNIDPRTVADLSTNAPSAGLSIANTQSSGVIAGCPPNCAGGGGD